MRYRIRTRNAESETSVVPRMLTAIGANHELTQSILGDLSEEFAVRAERDGAAAARVWYACDAMRSMPHLVREAMRHGSATTRLRLGGVFAGLTLAATSAVLAFVARTGPPARLVADTGHAGNEVVINSIRPAQLEMRVLDSKGRVLKSDSVRYQRASGAPIIISPSGVLSCVAEGDVRVRASIASLTRYVDVLCRPVHEVRASSWINFVLGDPPRPMPYEALGATGATVTELRGAVSVADTAIAGVRGPIIHPRGVGQTVVAVDVGDHSAMMQVVVHEPVPTLAGLRPDQRFVAVPVKLAQGDTVRWPLPSGVFWLKYLSRHPGAAPPTITVEGGASCDAGSGLRVYRLSYGEYGARCWARPDGSASVVIGHGKIGASVVEGSLALERIFSP